MDASFASLLRRHRGLLALTQEELAERSGLTVQAISLLERGLRLPRSTTVEFLAESLKLDVQQRAIFAAASRRQLAAEDERDGKARLAIPRPAPRSWRRLRGRTLAVVALAALLAVLPVAAVLVAHRTTASRIAPPPTCSNSYPCQPTTAVVNFNGKCLDMVDSPGSDDAAAQISWCDRGAAQFQRLISLGSADFLIQNANSGKCFSIRDHDSKPGGAVVQAACNWSGGDEYQRWYLLDPTSQGFVQIANKGAGGLVMRPTGCKPTNGTRISMHVSGECRADLWKF